MPSTQPKIVYGVVNADGSIKSGDTSQFSVYRQATGQYVISFTSGFIDIPAISGNQVLSDSLGQYNTDGIVFPFLSAQSATVLTGDSHGSKEDRSFSFIAVGPV